MMTSQTQTLPTEIEFDILSRLTVKILSRFKSVSKHWLGLITNPHFIKTHLHTYNNKSRKFISGTLGYPSSFYLFDSKSPNDHAVHLIDFNVQTAMIKSSCYGLLLILMHNDNQYSPFMWNPSTGSNRKIPLPDNLLASDIHGIGYDSIRNNFKLVMVIESVPLDYQTPCVVHVFSFKTGSWKRIKDIPNLRCGSSVVLEGVPYWFAITRTFSAEKYMIVYFDPNDDKMKELPSPEPQGDVELTVLGENLCLADNHRDGIDVWVMKKSSWSKMLGFTHRSYLDFLGYWRFRRSMYVKPLCFAEENDVLIMINRHLVIFNMKENTFKSVDPSPDFKESFQNTGCYVESLVSPYVGFGQY